MIAYSTDYTGCKVIIRDESLERIIMETIVLEYDKSRQLITVEDHGFGEIAPEQLSLLILAADHPFEFQGNLRKQTHIGEREIALFKGQEKESRSSTRYEVNLPAHIESLIIAGRLVPLRVPPEVLVINFSASGVLIRGELSVLNLETAFQLRLEISGSDTIINAVTKRIHVLGKGQVEYGCKFTSVPNG